MNENLPICFIGLLNGAIENILIRRSPSDLISLRKIVEAEPAMGSPALKIIGYKKLWQGLYNFCQAQNSIPRIHS